MKVIASLEEPSVVRGILEHFGLPAGRPLQVKACVPPVTGELFEHA